MKNDKLLHIITQRKYNPQAGYIDYDLVDGEYVPTGTHIKYMKNSNAQRYWKKYSNKKVRRGKRLFKGNQYRRVFDYWYTLW